MYGPFFEQYMQSQKNLFDQWQANMKTAFQGKAETPPSEPSGENAEEPHDFSREFWNKIQEGSKTYQAMMDLWKDLSAKGTTFDRQTAQEVYATWLKQGYEVIQSVLIPSMPEYMRDFAARSAERMKSSADVVSDYNSIWAENEDAVSKAWMDSLGKGPKGYISFLEAWQNSYEATVGKLMNAPTFGKDMDFWKQQKASFDRFIKYNIASTQFYASLSEIIREATKKVLDDYVEMCAQQTQPKTFEEFYKYWTKVVSAYYEKVLFTDEVSVLAGNMVNEMSKFKKEYDKLCEMYLDSMPVPKKSDMDDLYKTVHELKREVRQLRKEVNAAKPKD